MRILLVISQWSPSHTPNTLRWVPLVKEFQNKGHEISVLTTNRSGHNSVDEIDSVKVYRAGYNTLLDRIYDLRGTNNRRNELHSIPKPRSIFSGLTDSIVNLLWRDRYWPDGSKLFIKPGIKTGSEVIRNENITHVITVGLPFSAHLIGRQLKSESPRVHWHMDIQDPFSYSKEFRVNNYRKFKNKNISEESSAFSLADSISVTNAVAKKKYKELFADEANKIKVISPLFYLHNKTQYEVIPDRKKVHLGYAGSFYNGVRSPKIFLEFLNKINGANPELVNKLQIHFFGQLDPQSYGQFKAYPELRNYFIFHGFLSREAAINGLEQMDIVMNFGNTTNYHLPSKVVDYLYLGKPLLNWISRSDDSTSEFLKTHDLEVCNIDIAQLGQQEATDLFKRFVFREREYSVSDIERVKAYLPESIGKQYLDLLRS